MTNPRRNKVLETYEAVLSNLPQAERRPAQEQMIACIADSLERETPLVIEAGTGSGKSFGYLIPALLQQKRPIVISTATIALQEQLLNKDIPQIVESLGITNENGEPPIVKLVKGRGNYLCIQKLLEFEKQIKPTSRDYMMLQYIKGEWQDDWDGDQANLELSIPYPVWSEIKSDTEDCLGRKCQFFMDNPYRVAREDLDKADIIVANHALYLQDVIAGKTLLPPHDIVIFDEAHQLKSYAVNAFTTRIGKNATTKLFQKIQRRLQPIPEQFHRLVIDTESAMMEWLFRNSQPTFRLFPDDWFLALIDKQVNVLEELLGWLGGVDVKQLPLIETELDQDRATVHKNNCLTQLQGLIGRWQLFQASNPVEANAQDAPRVNWVELNNETFHYELKSTPLTIAPFLQARLWNEKTAILTSATLSVNQQMRYFKQDVGLNEAEEHTLPSPFDYVSQCLLYLPRHLPEPNTAEFTMACSEEILSLLALTQGRAFILLTSYQAMKTLADALIPQLPFPCKVQGEMPRQRLIDWFKATPNSVVFATSTFWEGIDIPGDSLSCVIMDKIPFTAPNDPVQQATVDYLKRLGQDWFSDYVLPQAVIKLKQGFGRLIRTRTDKGIVAILDPRITKKGYGKVIRRSLPECAVIQTLEELEGSWQGLTADTVGLRESLPTA